MKKQEQTENPQHTHSMYTKRVQTISMYQQEVHTQTHILVNGGVGTYTANPSPPECTPSQYKCIKICLQFPASLLLLILVRERQPSGVVPKSVVVKGNSTLSFSPGMFTRALSLSVFSIYNSSLSNLVPHKFNL